MTLWQLIIYRVARCLTLFIIVLYRQWISCSYVRLALLTTTERNPMDKRDGDDNAAPFAKGGNSDEK